MKKFTVVFLGVLASLVLAVTSFATDSAMTGTVMGTALSSLFTDTILPIIVSLVGGLVGLILLTVKKKLNVQLSAETEAWISKQAETAVQGVAEKAAAKFKGSNISFSKNEKLEAAIASLITKVPHLTPEQADGYIAAALARIPGVGATGDASLVSKS